MSTQLYVIPPVVPPKVVFLVPPSPRLCLLEKQSVEEEYGFNYHAEKIRGQFVGIVDKDSYADVCGLKTGDRIFAINGRSIAGEKAKIVLQRMQEKPTQMELLVLTEDEAAYYSEKGIEINTNMDNILRLPEPDMFTKM